MSYPSTHNLNTLAIIVQLILRRNASDVTVKHA